MVFMFAVMFPRRTDSCSTRKDCCAWLLPVSPIVPQKYLWRLRPTRLKFLRRTPCARVTVPPSVRYTRTSAQAVLTNAAGYSRAATVLSNRGPVRLWPLSARCPLEDHGVPAEAKSSMRPSMIPCPALTEGFASDLYHLPRSPIVYLSSELLRTKAEYLQQAMQQRFGVHLVGHSGSFRRQDDTSPSVAVRLCIQDHVESLQQFRWSQEAYELSCDASGIRITATAPNGIFYGIQSLLQALMMTPDGPAMAHVHVIDGPRFSWRGVLLDVGRHFFPVPFIKKLLDLMALYKLNRFHWHLTEDQGWRLDVPALPRLAEIAAWRGTRSASSTETSSSSSNSQQHDSQQADPQHDAQSTRAAAAADRRQGGVLGRSAPSASVYHGGCYSTADVATVVAYAAERCIEVVPEIELPGHCCAALAAYPHLSCTGDVSAVSTHWGIHDDVYCAGNDSVFQFLGTVFDQVAKQFPCQYVHIGGDEVPKVRWEACSKCQSRLKKEGLSDVSELQSWFVQQVSKMLADRGRKLLGWDEILEGGLADEATVMSWRGTLGGVVAARAGHDVIMTPTSHCYFDYKQAPSPEEPGAWYACLPLHTVYQYDPVPRPHNNTTAPPAAPGMQEPMQTSSGGGAEASDADASQHEGSMQDVRQQDATTAGDQAMATSEDTAGAAPNLPQQQQQQQEGEEEEEDCTVQHGVATSAESTHSSRGDSGLGTGSGSDHGGSTGCAAGVAGGPFLSEAEAERVLGGQANLWCEYVQDEETAEYMLLPRLAAMSEALWSTPESKDYQSFLERLDDHLPVLSKLGYLYRPLQQHNTA